MPVDLQAVCEIIERHGYQKASLIGILQDIQGEMNYLPRKALVQVAKSLDIPLTHIYEVATFYKAFSLEPKGKTYHPGMPGNSLPCPRRRQSSRLS